MLSALLIAAAEPSKTPFFIVGGALAAFAVVLSFVGLSQPAFPNNERASRAVMLVSLLFVVATIAAAVVTDP